MEPLRLEILEQENKKEPPTDKEGGSFIIDFSVDFTIESKDTLND
mgnify:CR=1 FL=1